MRLTHLSMMWLHPRPPYLKNSLARLVKDKLLSIIYLTVLASDCILAIWHIIAFIDGQSLQLNPAHRSSKTIQIPKSSSLPNDNSQKSRHQNQFRSTQIGQPIRSRISYQENPKKVTMQMPRFDKATYRESGIKPRSNASSKRNRSFPQAFQVTPKSSLWSLFSFAKRIQSHLFLFPAMINMINGNKSAVPCVCSGLGSWGIHVTD